MYMIVQPSPDFKGEVCRSEIEKTIRLMCMPGSIYELRCPDLKGGTVAGWFYDLDRLADIAHELTDGDHAVHNRFGKLEVVTAPHVFLTLNPCHEDYLSLQPANSLAYCRTTTEDDRIIRRRRLLVDHDPRRMRGISSTAAELIAARDKALEVRDYLIKNGFPMGVLAMSGNGYHLVYAIDLPTESPLVERLIKGLADRFGSQGIEIDTMVHNPSRVCTLWGTWKRKGADTSQRPHRISRIEETPEVMETVPPELLETAIRDLASVKTTVEMGGDEDYGFASVAKVVETLGPKPGAHDINLTELDLMALWASRGLRCVPGKRKGMYEAECPCQDRHTSKSKRDGGNCLWKHEYPGYWCKRTGCPFNGGVGADDKRVDMFDAVVDFFGVNTVRQFCQPKGEVERPKKSNPAEQMVGTVLDHATVWRSDGNEPYISIRSNGHTEHYPVSSPAFDRWLHGICHEELGMMPREEWIKQVKRVLEYHAWKAPKHKVYVRIARLEDRIYWDLGNDAWEAIEITGVFTL
jgi:hypothetical protein